MIRRHALQDAVDRRRAAANYDRDVANLNRRRFDRFLNNIREGKDYTFLSVYFFNLTEAQEIADLLRNNSTLKYLSMPSCYTGRRKILPIMNSLKQNDLCQLTYLDLNDNRLEDSGCFIVCDFLKGARTVQSLSLRANRISGDGAASGAMHLAKVLRGESSIRRLELGQNKLGPAGAEIIDNALANNKTLEFLDISANDLLAEGVGKLKNVFTGNNIIKYLQLHHNNIGLEGAEQLASFLSQNLETKIEKLTLLDQYTRVLILRGVMDKCRTEELTEKFLEKFLMTSDFHSRKIALIRGEWETAKNTGQELVKLPQEVFEHQDAEAIKTFLKAALVEGLSANKAVKMLMVGRARAGKTSLTNSLVNDEVGLTEDNDARATVSVEIRPWKVEDATISVWDFAGQEEYYMTHTFFLSRRCVVVLIVDLARYKDFIEDVYYWVRAIQAHIPGVSFFMVGTHIDEMTPQEIEEKCADILIKFQEEERRVVLALDKQLELLEEGNQDNYATIGTNEDDEGADPKEKRVKEKAESPDYENEYIEGDVNVNKMNRTNVVYLDNAQMARVREQRARRPSILHNKVFPVSSKVMEGVPELREAIISHATDEEVAIRLPNSYVKLLEKLKEYGDENPGAPIVTRNEVGKHVGEEVYSKFDDEDEVDAALELLHLVGQILWYRTNNQLMDRVFVSPRWVVDITKALIRHDMFKTEHGNPGIIENLERPNNIKAKAFESMKKKFRDSAVFDMRFLGLLETWRNISEVNRYKLVSLLKEFDLIIPLPKRRKNDNDECLIPLYLKSSFHGKNEAKTDAAANLKRKFRKSIVGLIGEKIASKDAEVDKNRIIWRYDLREYLPEGIFFRLLVRCYSLGKIVQVEEDLLYIKIGPDIRVVLSEDRAKKCIEVAASHRKNFQLVWPALVLFATEFEELLRTAYRGVTCQVICISADSRLRERALCNHEEHKDMVPPIEYMHVVWGNINAVQVGVLLRMNNISGHIEKLENESNKFSAASEMDLLGKECFSLLERLLQNICKVNDIPIKNGRNLSAYLNSIKNSEKYKNVQAKMEGVKWSGEEITEEKLSEAADLHAIFKDVSGNKEALFDADFVRKVVLVAKKFIPNLEEKETEFEKNLRKQVHGQGVEPSANFLKARQNVAFDAVKNINVVAASAEGVGENKDLLFTLKKEEKDEATKENPEGEIKEKAAES